MADQLPLFPFTSQEDWYGELVFTSADDGSALSLAGRTFEMPVTQAVVGVGTVLVPPVITLTMNGGGLALKDGAPNTIVFRVPRTTAQAFPRAEFTADVLEVVSGERHVFMPVRIAYTDPSGLRSYNSRFVGVGVSFASRTQPIVTPVAIAGRQGAPGATIITGVVPPVPADGRDGDFWIEDRTATNRGRRMYGPKAGGAWPGTPWTIQVAAYADVPGLTDALGGKRNGAAPTAADLAAGTSTTAIPAVADVSTIAFAAPGLTGMRSAETRAGDYMRLPDIGASVGSIPARMRAGVALLKTRGGGYLDLGRGSLDFGLESFTLLDNYIKIVADGQSTTEIIGRNQYADIMSMGDGTANPAYSKFAGFRVTYLGPGTSGNSAVHLRNCYECDVEEVDTAGPHGNCLRITGALNQGNFGGNTYNNRIKKFKNYDGTKGMLIGDVGSIPQGIYLLDCGFVGKAIGIHLRNVSALFLGLTEVLAAYEGLVADPGPGQTVSNIQATDSTIDTCTSNLMRLADAGGTISAFEWTGSSILSGQGDQNILISGSAPEKIDGVKLRGVRMGNAVGHGLIALNVSGLDLYGCSNDGNNVGNGGGVGYYFGQGCRRCFVRGGSARGRYRPGNLGNEYGWQQNQRFGVSIDGDADYCGVIGVVDLGLNTIGPIKNTSSGTHNFLTDFIA